jgi:hypothetical protein
MRLLSAIAIVLFATTTFLLGIVVSEHRAPPVVCAEGRPRVEKTIDLVDEFGCDSPALRLFVNGCEPKISFVTEWPYYRTAAFTE